MNRFLAFGSSLSRANAVSPSQSISTTSLDSINAARWLGIRSTQRRSFLFLSQAVTQRSYPGTSTRSRRLFSHSSVLRANGQQWYQGRPVQAIRSSPLTKIQSAIDKRVPKVWLFYGILIANGLVFLAWSYADDVARRFKDFGPLSFMFKNFASSWANILRPWTLLTSCFSHRDAAHIIVNLISFYFMGPAAFAILTTSQSMSLYLLAGLGGAAVQLISDFLRRDLRGPDFALGASGAISGVLSFFAMAFPNTKLFLMMVLPVPAWAAVTSLVCYDMYLALLQPNGGVAAAAHLGGAGAGVLYYLRLSKMGRLGRLPY
ncbi:MAG: hypothetical protein CYPHOPRED_005386 [Cyphobasidiales sp. Tagirdzhanova-0007]|nr:MAG: hypothetical protein CYPHOPRED_005386 [Cyphobasidiales sp. Tagirdzhanova-0007]